MKTLNISEFKQKCLELLDPERLSLEPIEITRHGKVVALVTEPRHDKGSLKGSVTYCLEPGESIESINFADEWALS